MLLFLQVNHNCSALDLAAIPIHLRCIDQEAPRIAARPAHQPLPQHALDAKVQDLEHVDPCVIRDEVKDGTPARAREDALIRGLQVIEEGGLLAGTPVDVAEDMEAGPDAPKFAEEVGAA